MVSLVHYDRFGFVVISSAPDCGVECHLCCWDIPACLYQPLLICCINMKAFSFRLSAQHGEKLVSLVFCRQGDFKRSNRFRALGLLCDSAGDAHR